MKFKDLFVAKWLHSDPEVRKKAVEKMTDIKLLKQVSEKDSDRMVRTAAAARAGELEKNVSHA